MSPRNELREKAADFRRHGVRVLVYLNSKHSPDGGYSYVGEIVSESTQGMWLLADTWGDVHLRWTNIYLISSETCGEQ